MAGHGCRFWWAGGAPLRAAGLVFFSLVLWAGAAVPLLDTYYSPKNKDRPVRKSTRFIVLHTTEGSLRGSGAKLKRNGEAHYMVDTSGRVYRIIDRKRVAYHCGRSMWNGLSSLDNYAVGIEVVGYHDKDPTAAQCKALKELLAELKRTYKIPDSKVLTHSMVAYGAPNQWHKRSHRGRKRCGMRMALPSVRRKLGLASKPASDPDVKAGRLVVADRELQQLLYSVEKGKATKPKPAPEVAEKPAPPDRPPTPAPPSPPAPSFEARTLVAHSSSAPAQPPDGAAPPTVDEDVATAQYAAKEAAAGGNVIGPRRSAWDIARDAYNAATTVYEFPDGSRKTGAEIRNWRAMPPGTRVLVAEGDGNEAEAVSSLSSTGLTAADFTKAVDAALVAVAGDEWNSERTLYVQPDGTCVRGSDLDAAAIARLSPETRVLTGYKIGGPVTARNPAFNICGPSWRDEGTLFLFPGGKMESGDKVDPRKIPPKTMILYKD